jgi:hypothetical protein
MVARLKKVKKNNKMTDFKVSNQLNHRKLYDVHLKVFDITHRGKIISWIGYRISPLL